ncbi:hypothetical protein ACB092_11G068200 [Castanea dentata]
MEKTVQPSNKCKRNHVGLEDRISQFPDEILVSILSFLTFEEAVRTSVLSHRWKHLWPFFTGSLDFDDPDTMWDIADEKKQLKVERNNFAKRVNRILKLHQGSNIDQFRVCFEFNRYSKHRIDGWIDFAMSKRVKRLELDFTPTWVCKSQMRYTFPHERFTKLESSVGVSCIESLMSLTLMNVRVTGKLLEHLLSNCPLLERLHVSDSDDLVTLKEKLEFLKFQPLTNLRHLKWRVTASDGESLVYLISMIEAAPFLQKFTLELLWSKPLIEREFRKVKKYPNEHLKEVEIMGFVGRAIDMELTVYLLESAIKLEKIVINPRSPALVGTPWEFETTEKNEGAIECANQLKKNLPQGAELLIL